MQHFRLREVRMPKRKRTAKKISRKPIVRKRKSTRRNARPSKAAVSFEVPANSTWATEVLREDHARIQDLIQDFDQSRDPNQRREILDLVVGEMRVHRALVEEILLPAVREASG